MKSSFPKNLLFPIIVAIVFSPSLALSQEAQDSTLTEPQLDEILAMADSISGIQDSLRNETKIQYKLFAVMNRLNGDGSLKSSDTTIALITQKGDEELDREIIYSSKDGDGKSRKGERELGLSFDDPAYNFSLTASDDSSYTISVVPKSSPPEEGEYVGTIELDKGRYFIRRFDFEVPDPEGALKEFAIAMDFELLEGELAVPVTMKMRGYVKALIGIIKVRFAGEFSFSDYQILE